jgi:phosphoglycolate phosphatase
MYRTILFDLDGTLINSAEGITKCIQYALEKFNIFEPDLKDLERFIGPPIEHSFKEYYGFDDEKTIEAVRYFRERYSVKGIKEHTLFTGVEELLRSLKSHKIKLGIASSKLEESVIRILQGYKIHQYFDVLIGSVDGLRTEKREVIQEAVKQLAVTDKAEVLMIGDRKYDVLGAKEEGIDCIGILEGFGGRAELKEAGAKYIVNDIKELKELLFQLIQT